jgi:hemoglobin-like flavoprotein
MSEDHRATHAHIQRYPDYYTVVGQSTMVRPIESVARDLARSGFMQDWIIDQISNALRRGTVFKYVKSKSEDPNDGWIGRDDRTVAEYRVATVEEVEAYSKNEVQPDQNQGEDQADQKGHKISMRAYNLCFQGEPDLIESYNSLPNQAKVILQILSESKLTTYTEISINDLLVKNAERLKTKQTPFLVFSFYRSRYLREGYLKELR